MIVKSSFKYKQVIVVRMDLNMSRGKIAVQVAHASLNAALRAMKERPEWFKEWMKEGQKKVVVKVDNEDQLIEVYSKALSLGLPVEIIEDRGLTEIPPGTKTSVGIGPAPEKYIDKVTGNLKLLK